MTIAPIGPFNTAGHHTINIFDMTSRGMTDTPSTRSLLMSSFVQRKWSLAASAFLISIAQGTRLSLPYSTKYITDTVLTHPRIDRIQWVIGLVFAALLLGSFAQFIAAQLLTRSGETFVSSLRASLHSHLLHLDLRYLDGVLSGSLVSRVMSDIDEARTLVGLGLLEFFTSLVSFCLVVSFFWFRSPSLTLALTICQTLTFVGLYRIFETVRPEWRKSSQLQAGLAGHVTESLGGVRIIKAYCAEARDSAAFAAQSEQSCQQLVATRGRASVIALLGGLNAGLSMILVIIVGSHKLRYGLWTVGDYIQSLALSAYISGPVIQLVNIGTTFVHALAGLDRVVEVLGVPQEHVTTRRPIQPLVVRGNVAFDNVSFAYEQDRYVLTDISFETRPGTITALVGPSGSGKSTLVSLLCAFYHPTAGRISIDGIDLATIPLDAYRRYLGLVSQDTFLFEGSIRDNILFSKPDAGEAQFLRACQLARVDDFAGRYPDSYDTRIGERGVKLSGGQRQRISIARALLVEPRILLLDEATSNLDSESEAIVQEGLDFLMKGRTTIVIAHRLSTIQRADQVLVLDCGHIVERGTHNSLYTKQGRYYDLWALQQYTPTTCDVGGDESS